MKTYHFPPPAGTTETSRHYFHRYESAAVPPPIEVIASGWSRWFGSHSFKRAETGFWGIEYVTSGEATFRQDDKVYHIRAGKAFVLRRGGANLYQVGPCGYLHKRYLQLRGMAIDQIVRACGLSEVDIIDVRDRPATGKLFRRIHRLFVNKVPGWEIRVSTMAYELLYSLGRDSRIRLPETIRHIIEYVDHATGHPLSGREVAEYSGLSMTHLSRLMNRHLGASPKRYIIERKMALARHLLQESDIPAKEIARRCGYEDPLHFSAQFRVHAGISPLGFRMKKAEGPELDSSVS